MSSIPFMYIIRSRNRTSGDVNNAYFRLNGLPSQFKKFKVEVVNFYHNTEQPVANTLVELRADFPFLNGYDTLTGRMSCIATNGTSMGSASFEFMIESFNGRTINFSIFDNDADNANAVGEWVLYLKMIGIEE